MQQDNIIITEEVKQATIDLVVFVFSDLSKTLTLGVVTEEDCRYIVKNAIDDKMDKVKAKLKEIKFTLIKKAAEIEDVANTQRI